VKQDGKGVRGACGELYSAAGRVNREGNGLISSICGDGEKRESSWPSRREVGDG
jgi:hypothetical protein